MTTPKGTVYDMALNRQEDEDGRGVPPGFYEGLGSLDAPPDTPDIMRDCIREQYGENPRHVELFKAATRLADDLKRRGFPQQKAIEFLIGYLHDRRNLAKPEHRRQIESAVRWVYEKQEHGLTCTGALLREGVCFLSQRTCRFNNLAQEIQREKKDRTPSSLPVNWRDHLSGAHPSESLFAEWAYLALVEAEKERNLAPGDPNQPILVGFRTISDKVRAAHMGASSFDKNAAGRIMHLLADVGLIRKIVQGRSGTSRRKANGYIRVVPIPQPSPNPPGPHISPKYNPCVPNQGTYMCPDAEMAGLA